MFPVSLAKVDGGTVTKCNFAGDEKAGASWTDKVLANKSEAGGSNKSGGEGEGAEEDEWVRMSRTTHIKKRCSNTIFLVPIPIPIPGLHVSADT